MKLYSHLWFLLLPFLFLILGDSLVLQRVPNGPSHELTIRGDALTYLRMVEQGPSSASGHKRYRVLVPFIASMLPFPPGRSLLVISYASLFACYLLALLISAKMGFPWFASFLGVFSVYSSAWHLYNYQNPFLTDAFGLAALFALLFCVVAGSYVGFLAVATVGILGRETVSFLVPLWITTRREWWKTIFLLSSAIAILAIPKATIVFSSGGGATFFNKINAGNAAARVSEIGSIASYVFDLVFAWSYLWIIAPVGIMLLPLKWFWPMTGGFVLLFLGAFLVTIASPPGNPDTGRLFSLLAPVMVVGATQVFSSLWNKRAWPVIVLFAALFSAQLFTGVPTVVTPRDSWVFGGGHYRELMLNDVAGSGWVIRDILIYWPRLAVVLAGLCASGAAMWILREDLRQQLRDKWTLCQSTLR